MRKIPIIDLHAEHSAIHAELQDAWQRVIQSSQFVKSKIVEEFELALQVYTGSNFVISCGNGTDALQLAYMALNLQVGDEVIIPSFNYIAAAEAASLLGLKPVFADIDPTTFTIQTESIEQCITPKTKAIVAVHLFGACAHLEQIQQICKKHQLFLIEDNAQSLGTSYYFSDGRICQAGTIGDIATTSFFPTKNLGALGDGGALMTQEESLALRLRQLANHGQSKQYHHILTGINSRLDSIQAAILLVKLKYLTQKIELRKKHASILTALLKYHSEILCPTAPSYSDHGFHQYTIRVAHQRDAFLHHLKQHGIGAAVYYQTSIHQQPVYAATSSQIALPHSELAAKEVLSLPVHPMMTDEDFHYLKHVFTTWKA